MLSQRGGGGGVTSQHLESWSPNLLIDLYLLILRWGGGEEREKH